MIKILLLIFFLTAPALQQEAIAISASVVAEVPTQISDGLPPIMDLMQAGPPNSNGQASTNWDVVVQAIDPQTGAEWLKPGGSYSVYPAGSRTSYNLTFQTDCPQNEVGFTFAASGVSVVYLNG
jgi:hypothetical protein